MSWKDDLKNLRETIQQYRDEARVQLHLAREDVKDEWDDLEEYWDRFRRKLEEIARDAEDTSQETRKSAKALGDDLKRGYDRLLNRLK
ncbi:MAG: hypothetical protein R3280_13565 [Marinobacter sp.]|uniref:hypothetical protein n=1 Tax=Marinobacter sp. TaxID=50741 RepID=UPI00299F315C|nr:hypothetical protein [Marinobacter sp.]MDX1635664.1 hypothetical protein [Marinobacter sp.]